MEVDLKKGGEGENKTSCVNLTYKITRKGYFGGGGVLKLRAFVAEGVCSPTRRQGLLGGRAEMAAEITMAARENHVGEASN